MGTPLMDRNAVKGLETGTFPVELFPVAAVMNTGRDQAGIRHTCYRVRSSFSFILTSNQLSPGIRG